MNPLDDWMNDLTDDDAFWGPLAFLRPEPNARFTPQRTLAIAVIHGALWGMAGNVVFGALARAHGLSLPPVAVLPLVYVLLIHGVLRVTLARSWDRRAAHLARRAELSGHRNGSRRPSSGVAPAARDD